MNKPPAFQFYADDFLGGVGDMTCEEVGAYIRLLCHQWNKGGLANDDARLQIMAGHCQASALATAKTKFGMCEDGFIRNARLERERTKQDAYRQKQAENGAKRWGSSAKPDAKPDAKPHAKPDALAKPSHMPNACSPSPSPSINTSRSAPDLVFPENLNSPVFKELWNDWVEHLTQKRKKPTQKTAERQLRKLSQMGQAKAAESINNSITNNWQGLFEPKEPTNNGSQHQSQPKDWKQMSEKEIIRHVIG